MSSPDQPSLNLSDMTRILARMQSQGAVDTDASRTKYRAAEVRARLVKIQDEADSLKMELMVLDALLGELQKKDGVAKPTKAAVAAPAKKAIVKTSKAKPAAKAPEKAGMSSPLGHRPAVPQLSPKKRAERAQTVLEAARAVVKRDGVQITAASVAQQLVSTKTDIGVPPDRMTTAVGNIIFRAKNEFQWLQNGVYRHLGKGLNGHANA